MKAVVYTRHGPPEVLQLKEIPKPDPRDNEVLVKVFDAVAKIPSAQARKALKPSGTYLNVHRDAHAKRDTTPLQELLRLKELLEANTFKPVIDRVYPLEHIVEAHRYVDQGHKKGNVVLTVQHESKI